MCIINSSCLSTRVPLSRHPGALIALASGRRRRERLDARASRSSLLASRMEQSHDGRCSRSLLTSTATRACKQEGMMTPCERTRASSPPVATTTSARGSTAQVSGGPEFSNHRGAPGEPARQKFGRWQHSWRIRGCGWLKRPPSRNSVPVAKLRAMRSSTFGEMIRKMAR